MRYAAYLVACILMEILAVPAAFILPWFARDGWLPRWLLWFQTVDNSLHGDRGWEEEHWQWRHRFPDLLRAYVGYVGWLLRNRAYGFKWTVLAAPVAGPRGRAKFIGYKGDLGIKNRDNAKAGVLCCRMGRYWQYKRVWQIPGKSMCIMLNFGWQLDGYITNPSLHLTEPRALFMCSPRLSAFRPASVN